MKKILVDLYKVKNEFSGLGQFSLQFATYLSEHYGHEFEFHFLVPREHDLDISPMVKLIKVNPLMRFWKYSHEQYDLWHSLHQFPSYSPPKNFKQLLTVHDLNFLIEKNDEKKERYLKKMQTEVANANFIATISLHTKNQILQSIPDSTTPIEVIHNGLSHLPDQQPTRPKTKIGDKFFFSISQFARKKNFEVLIPLMNHFPDYKLVIAGDNNTEYGSHIKSEINKLGLEERILLPGKIPASEKAYFMNLCDAFLFPSLAEGFGMPPIEAMQFGKPVFLSNLTSLPEIGGDVAYYFNDFDPENMASIIKSNLKDFTEKGYEMQEKVKAHAAQYTWKENVEKYVALYRRLTN